MINQQGSKKQKIAIILLNKQYIISWIDSGLIDEIIKSGDFEIDVFAPKHVFDVLPKETVFHKFRINSTEPSKSATHLVALNWVALRSKSTTFRFSLQRTFRSDYWFFPIRLGLKAGLNQTVRNIKTIIWNLSKKRLTVLYFFAPMRIFGYRFKNNLGSGKILPNQIRENAYNWLIIPCNAIDELTTDYLAEAKNLKVKTIIAIDNWDNLTSKSVYVTKPDYLTVMGNRCVEHAQNIHDISPEQVLPFGIPRFDGYRSAMKSQLVNYKTKSKKSVLYAGFSVAHSEKRVVEAIANFLDEKYGPGAVEFVYRPHPIPIARIDPFELSNRNITTHNHGNLERTSLPGLSNGLIDSLISADVIIGAPTTLMLEAMILKRPCVIDLSNDGYHRTTASNSAKHFVHMKDLLSVDNLSIGQDIPSIIRYVDDLLNLEASQINYDMTHLFNVSDPLYKDQLLNFLVTTA